jgi:hypothetical protein
VRIYPNLADIYRRKVAALQDLLESDATRTEAVEIIRSLVEQVIFRPTAEAGLEVELVGDIAGMVHLAQNSNENSPVSGAVHDEFTRSVKVVAGTYTELDFSGHDAEAGPSDGIHTPSSNPTRSANTLLRTPFSQRLVAS